MPKIVKNVFDKVRSTVGKGGKICKSFLPQGC